MKKIFLIFLLLLSLNAYALDTISGNVRQDDVLYCKSYLFDSKTNLPVEGAKIFIPDLGYSTVSGKDGSFQLNVELSDNAILQIEKDGYNPFSLTLDKFSIAEPMKLSLEKNNKTTIIIDKGVFHLGDNLYSKHSANCKEFRAKPLGAYYSKTISLPKPENSKSAQLVFGSVIGLDTKLARESGQNKIISTYSSPTEIFFNGHKIGELHLNGDNIKINIPSSLFQAKNEIVVKTGKNLFQYSYTDYDDMEFANLKIEYEDYYFADK